MDDNQRFASQRLWYCAAGAAPQALSVLEVFSFHTAVFLAVYRQQFYRYKSIKHP